MAKLETIKQVLIHSEEISEAKQQELSDAGFITLRVVDVQSFRVLTPVPPTISGDAFVAAALESFGDPAPFSTLGRKLIDRMKK